MLLEDLAEELVEATSGLIGGRTLNVMNTDGVIIASTQHERIGTYHQGAWEAARSGKVVNIRSDQLDQYPGSKEGWNMPLRVNGTIIGVIGIYGNPDETRDIAHLLEVYAAKCYQMEAMMRPQLSQNVLRSQLLMHLLSPSDEAVSAARGLMESLNLQFQFPVYAAVISSASDMSLPGQADALCRELDELHFLNKRTDVWSVVDERMVLIFSSSDRRSRETLTCLTERLPGCRISFGGPCRSLREIQRSYKQASGLDRSCTEPVCDIQKIPFKCRYTLSCTAASEAEFLEPLYQKLISAFGEEESDVLLRSTAAYYHCERSVSAAAKSQFVHKNTLQYRVKRLLQALEAEDLPGFWQEYLVRLLLQYLSSKPGSK